MCIGVALSLNILYNLSMSLFRGSNGIGINGARAAQSALGLMMNSAAILDSVQPEYAHIYRGQTIAFAVGIGQGLLPVIRERGLRFTRNVAVCAGALAGTAFNLYIQARGGEPVLDVTSDEAGRNMFVNLMPAAIGAVAAAYAFTHETAPPRLRDHG